MGIWETLDVQFVTADIQNFRKLFGGRIAIFPMLFSKAVDKNIELIALINSGLKRLRDGGK